MTHVNHHEDERCATTGSRHAGGYVFRDFRYRTLDSWSRRRRVVGKAEHKGVARR
jgi:hypothetical protein